MTFIDRAMWFGLGATIFGCSSAALTEHAGKIGLNLQIAPGIVINTIDWKIANSSTEFSQMGSVDVHSSNTASFQIGGLPSGDGYSITLSATSADGSETCMGSATFSISAHTTATVPVVLYCAPSTPDAGSAAIAATVQVCANITSVSASPSEASVGSSVRLSALASAGATPVTFAWTASAGTFDDATSASPIFTCPSDPATVTITVVASPSASGCTTNTTESVTVDCDALDPTFTNVYTSIIGQRCISCHQPGKSGFTVGMLDMSTPAAAYANLVGVPAAGTGAGASGVQCATLGIDAAADGGAGLLRVSAGDSADSLLYDKVSAKLAGTNPPCGSGMPLGGAALTQPQVDLIGAWITAGALNN